MNKTNCGHPVAFLRSGSCLNRAYLLAGGESRRMGQDKLFLQLGDTSLLEHGLSILNERFSSVKIAARSDSKFSHFSYDVVIDSPKAKGPMAGLIAALEDCPDSCCFVLAVDLPDISTQLIDQLLENYNGEDFFGVDETVSTTDETAKNIQPLCGIWSKNVLPILYRLASKENYRLSDLLAEIQTGSIKPQTDRWRNLNSPSDLSQLSEICEGGINGKA